MTETAKQKPSQAKKRRPYRRPEILSREQLEAIAAVCSPIGKSNPGACPAGPISS
jgi:hypothetical protein